MDEWVRTDAPPEAIGSSGTTSAARRRPERTLPPEVATEIRRKADTATARQKEALVERMQQAVAAYERGRVQEAGRLARAVADVVPTVAEVRRLAGLSAYREGRWRQAVLHLEAYAGLGGDLEHIPALMDCYRALGRKKKVNDLWAELRGQSPSVEVLTEARLVVGGVLADGGDLDGAISLLAGAGAGKALRNPADRHVRQWYALGDLYERAGDLPRARELFERVAMADPEAYDVLERLDSLGPVRGRSRPPRSDSATRGGNDALRRSQ
jgi:tetratricopeptide (TPR) repeat protein